MNNQTVNEATKSVSDTYMALADHTQTLPVPKKIQVNNIPLTFYLDTSGKYVNLSVMTGLSIEKEQISIRLSNMRVARDSSESTRKYVEKTIKNLIISVSAICQEYTGEQE